MDKKSLKKLTVLLALAVIFLAELSTSLIRKVY